MAESDETVASLGTHRESQEAKRIFAEFKKGPKSFQTEAAKAWPRSATACAASTITA